MKLDKRQTMLHLSPVQTEITHMVQKLPGANSHQINFSVPVYPEGHTGPGRLAIVGSCDNKGTKPCGECGHAGWTGFTYEFLWVGNRFHHGRIDRKEFRSLKAMRAEIESRVA